MLSGITNSKMLKSNENSLMQTGQKNSEQFAHFHKCKKLANEAEELCLVTGCNTDQSQYTGAVPQLLICYKKCIWSAK